MEIEGNELEKYRKIIFKDYLRVNKLYLESIFEDNINLPSILVKIVDEKDFEKIWEKKECGSFYKEFINKLSKLKENDQKENTDAPRDVYLRDLLQDTHSCEPIVAFVSDLKLNQYSNEIITSPGIYVKEKKYDEMHKKDDDVNLDFGILYSLIKAQIYYSMSRTDIPILAEYNKGIKSVLYSAMALKVMKDSEFEKLIEHQINARETKSSKLAGSWAIPLDLLILSSQNRSSLDDILDDDIIRKVFFGEIDDNEESEWLYEITEKVYRGKICK